MSNYDITKLSNFNLDTTNNLKLTPSNFSNKLVIFFFIQKIILQDVQRKMKISTL